MKCSLYVSIVFWPSTVHKEHIGGWYTVTFRANIEHGNNDTVIQVVVQSIQIQCNSVQCSIGVNLSVKLSKPQITQSFSVAHQFYKRLCTIFTDSASWPDEGISGNVHGFVNVRWCVCLFAPPIHTQCQVPAKGLLLNLKRKYQKYSVLQKL